MTPEIPNAPGPEAACVRLLLVDDHAIWRGGIRSILEGTEFEVVGEASSGAEGVEAARRLRPRVVLMDIRMNGVDGLCALRTIKDEHPPTSVVMLTTYDSQAYMARAVAGGASGYLLKGLRRAELLSALRAVAEGEMLLSRDDMVRALRALPVGRAQGRSHNEAGAGGFVQPLSEREKDVLRLLSSGLNNREIGAMLFVSENTVKTHVVHIIGKLGVSDRVQAAVWAARNGFLEAP